MQKKLFSIFTIAFFLISLLSTSFLPTQPVNAASAWKIEAVDSVSDIGEDISLAMGNDGFARIVYTDFVTAELKFVQCTNADCSEKNITTVATGLSWFDTGGLLQVQNNSLAMGNDGFARIVYSKSIFEEMYLIACTNADCSSKSVTAIDPERNTEWYPSIAMGSDGFARILYFEFMNTLLMFAQCTNADCSESNVATLDSGAYPYYSSLALNSDGFARISYYDEITDDFKFLQCTNADCSNKNVSTVDSGGVGSHLSLAMGSDGFAKISYYDGTNGDLKFAQCTNADCSESNIATLDSDGFVGLHTSIAVGDDGYARIAYRDHTNSDLKFIRCANDDCTQKETSIVDADGDVGLPASLAVGSDGFARISYYDNTNNNLKFALEEDAPETTPTPTPTNTPTPTPTNSPTPTPTGTPSPTLTPTNTPTPEPTSTPTPKPILQSNNTNSSPDISSPSAPTCADTRPLNTPNLFQIDTNNTQATLYFAPISDAHKYFIAYGNGESTNMYGVEFETGVSNGVLSYTVNALSPNSKYSFVVRGGNGCMPGEWGNTMTATTSNSSSKATSYYKNFVSRILSVFPRRVTNAGSGNGDLEATTVSVKECQDYVVQPGDNLWTIASQNLESGTKYSDLMQKNNLSSTLLNIGQVLRVGC